MRRAPFRFVAPVAVAAAISLGAWVPTMTASASADLPSVSAQDLLAEVAAARVPGVVGSIEWQANLGLPSLGSITSGGGQGPASDPGFDPTSLLSGTHQVNVWDRGATDQRLQLPRNLGETDVVRHGDQAWIYDSATDKVTHLVPAQAPTGHGTRTGTPGTPPLTPAELASRILARLTPSTAVVAGPATVVAGNSAYVLDLAPRPGTAGAAASTVDHIGIAVDPGTGEPVQVQVFARGASGPALSVGFTTVHFVAADPKDLAVPHGSSEVTKVLHGPAGTHRGGLGAGAAGTALAGPPWAGVLTLTPHLPAGAARQIQAATTPVSGTWGSGRLLHSTLLNALFLPDGRVLVGFVTPAALEAAAG